MSTQLSLRRAGTLIPLAPSGLCRLSHRHLIVPLLCTLGILWSPQLSTAGPVVTVTAVTPTSGPTTGGTSVTITGTGFTGASAVTFGVTAALSYVVNSSTSITATSPGEGPGTVDITVTVGVTSATSVADEFTFFVAPTSTPTLGEWSMISLALLLAGAGYLGIRKAAGPTVT
jgi:hypothetical protein